MSRLLLLGLLILSVLNGFCMDKEENNLVLHYQAETRASFAGGANTPFWLISNIRGLGSPEFNNGYVKGGIFKYSDSDTYKKFDWAAGIELAGAWNLPSPFSIRQLYGEIRYRKLKISLGSKNFKSYFNDIDLSTGDLLFSGNAPAIPQLRIGTDGFAPFWGTQGWLSVKAYLAYGFFTDSKWVKDWVVDGGDYASDVLFCSRGVWAGIGNLSKFPLQLHVGIEMATQFGGKVFKDGKFIKMPTDFKAWIKAFIPSAGDSSTPVEEQTNVQGNMNGEYVFSLTWIPKKEWKVRAYFEHYFEDHSQMFLQYGLWKDGLWGLEVSFPSNKFLDKILFEYISTYDQTGSVNHDITEAIPEQVSGRDNYYTHYLYGAWQNWGMTIGTPLAISPIYNRNHVMTIYDNRFTATHFGLQGSPLKELKWRLLMTFSRNWGTYIRPFSHRCDNFSGFFEITGKLPRLKGWEIKGALALDHGSLFGGNFGGMVSLAYEGNFSIKTKR